MGCSSEEEVILAGVRERNDKVASVLSGKVRKSKSKRLHEKEFKVRSSILTQLMEQKEFEAGHNFIISLMVHYVLGAIVTDLFEFGSLDLGFSNAQNIFGKPATTLKLLVLLHFTPILVVYPLMFIWVHYRTPNKVLQRLFDNCFYVSIVAVIFALFYIPFKVHFHLDKIPIGSCAIVVIEQLRLVMKIWAFTRTNVKRFFNKMEARRQDSRSSSETDETDNRAQIQNSSSNYDVRHRKNKARGVFKASNTEPTQRKGDELFQSFDANTFYPDFGKLVYFLYAPTLIYRDHYPRNDYRRWNFIFWHTVHVFGCIFFYNLICNRFGYVLLQDFGPESPMSIQNLVNVGFCQVICGISACMLGWLIMIHSVQNIFAEFLRFGDRGFYKDWWSCTSMSEYHRTWNAPVQDFLYNYVYKEAWEYGLGKRASWLPTMLVFVLSNIFHEYAMAFACQFFCPVMGILFMGPGTFLTFIPNKKFPKIGNVFMLWSLGVGHALFHIFYTAEHFARVNNCPGAANPIVDFFVPRLLTCGAVKWN